MGVIFEFNKAEIVSTFVVSAEKKLSIISRHGDNDPGVSGMKMVWWPRYFAREQDAESHSPDNPSTRANTLYPRT